MGLSEQSGVSASGGIGRVSLAPTDAATIECVVEQTNLSGWDPYEYRDEAKPIECNFTLTSTGTAPGTTVTAQIVCYGVITAISRGDDTGRRTWGLTIQLCYPKDATDNDPEVGVNPGQEFGTGASDTGLQFTPMAGFNQLGIMAIQFVTD
jgi:hypothetical protein